MRAGEVEWVLVEAIGLLNDKRTLLLMDAHRALRQHDAGAYAAAAAGWHTLSRVVNDMRRRLQNEADSAMLPPTGRSRSSRSEAGVPRTDPGRSPSPGAAQVQ